MKTQILRTLCMGLALLAGWSCTKERSYSDRSERSANAIAEARAYYESTAAPLTKTVAGREVPIKPLPGTMAPLWDRAVAVVSSDGTSWVDVPIEAAITYTAVRGGLHDHEEGEACGDHSPVQTVQKLSVYTAADGGQQLSVVTIVPESDCTVDVTGFSSATGLADFSGFASWHDLTGKLIRVAGYEQGTKTACVEATGDNRTEIGAVVGNTILYPEATNACITKAGWGACNYCHEDNCEAVNDGMQHCNVCGKYDPPAYPWKSKCICARCSTCGRRVKDPGGMTVTCTCGTKFTPAVCKICGKLVCSHLCSAEIRDDTPPPVQDPVTAHSAMFDAFFSPRYASDLIRMMKLADQMLDRDYCKRGDEYIHGMYVLEDGVLQNAVRAEARTKMRNHFIRYTKGFVSSRDLSTLAEGLHPVLDSYVDVQTKAEMLNYYSYLSPIQIVHGMNTSPYVNNPTPCMEALEYIYTELLKMNASTQESAIGALFDAWEKRAQGGEDLVDPIL